MAGVAYKLTLEDMISGPFQVISATVDKVNNSINKAASGIDKLAAGPVGLENATRRSGKSINDFREQLRRLTASRDATAAFKTDRIEKYNHLIDAKQKKIDGLTKKRNLPNVAPPIAPTSGGGNMMGGLVKGAAGLFAISQIKSAWNELRDFRAEVQATDNAIIMASGSTEQGAKNISFLESTAQRLGISLGAARNGFKTFSGSVMGTGLGMEQTRTIFGQVSTAIAANSLSADQAEGVFLALGQMMSKGTVSAEELKGQLGERLPGAFQAAARSMNVTGEQLNKMLAKGEVDAKKFLPGFARELEKTFGAGAVAQASGLRAEMNRQDITFSNLKQTLSSKLEPAFLGVIQLQNTLAKGAITVVEWMSKNESTVKTVGTALLAGAAAYTVYNGIASIAATRTAVLTAFTAAQAASTGGLTMAQWALNAAFYANPIGVVVAGVAALAGGIYWLWNNVEEFRAANVALWNGLVTLFTNVWNKVKSIAIGIGGVIKGIATGNITMIMDSVKETGNAFMQDVTAGVVESAAKGYANGVKSFRDDKAAEAKEEEESNLFGKSTGGLGSGLNTGVSGGSGTNLKAGITGVTGDAKASRNITININSLVGKQEFHTNTVKESISRIREEVSKVLIDVVNDANLAGA